MTKRSADTTEDSPVAYWPFDEGSGSSVTERVNARTAAIEHVFEDARFQQRSEPRWCEGVRGSALLFDGYSTWIESGLDHFTTSPDGLTVEAWVAPRSYRNRNQDKLDAIVSQHDRSTNRGFVLGLAAHGSWSFQVGLGDSFESVTTADHPLPKGEWSHIVGVYDASESEDSNASLTLYLNGTRIATTKLEADSEFVPASSNLRIGKNSQPKTVAGCFSIGMFDGLVDELSLFDTALSEKTIESRFDVAVKPYGGTPPDIDPHAITLAPSKYTGDDHRPEYHVIAPGHWMNEPHAPLYHDGQYHLFYQHNPKGPYWGNIHWGHWVSDDLVHWRHLPIALSPGPTDLDPDGIWSGNATYTEDGEPVLFYTAGNMVNTPDQVVATATPADSTDPDLVEWKKTGEVAIEKPRRIGLRENDFRDPFLWQEDGSWFCLVGAGERGGGGTALVYESRTLDEWQFKGHLFQTDHDEYPELGTVWELPILLSLGEDSNGDEKHVFIISPVGAGADVEVFYWLGEWDSDEYRFVPDDEEPQRIDYGGFGFTGPSAMQDPETGRCILFTIAQDQRRPQAHFDAGWAHNGGLPLELYLTDDDRLGIDPIEELTSLRDERLVDVSDRPIESTNEELTGITGDTLEISLELESDGASKYGIEFRKSPDGEEQTLIYYDEERERIYTHREENSNDLDVRSGLTERSSLIHSGELDVEGDTLKLHLFLDKSMVECYAQSRKSITTRVYPTRSDATGLSVWADGDVTVESLRVWELEGIGL